MSRAAAAACLVAAALLGLAAPAARAQPTPVTAWTDQADLLGEGNANWHSLAVMHMAMHDALNAAHPVYTRWAPPAADEPAPDGALPQAALETAAAAVLTALHPAHRTEVATLLAERLATMPEGPARDRGQALGTAVAQATLARRRDDGFKQVRVFRGSDVPGTWRPTPPRYQTSGITASRPFLFATTDAVGGEPPPALGSPRYRADAEGTRRLGGAAPGDRTPEQTDAAIFWAYQSTQRGYVHLAATLIDAEPGRLGLAEQARVMSQLTAAMADAAILVWAAKERWAFWRPVDAIRSGQFGVPADPGWSAAIETPPHPEYPSGHAADCHTGAALLGIVLRSTGPVTYTAQSAPHVASATPRPAEVWSSDMGTPPAPTELRPTPRLYPTMEATAQDCADARIWAGAHFPSANEEARRIARLIVARAVVALPPLPANER